MNEERDPSGEPLADPEEHPEQHAALQTGRQEEAEPAEDSDALDSEDQSGE